MCLGIFVGCYSRSDTIKRFEGVYRAGIALKSAVESNQGYPQFFEALLKFKIELNLIESQVNSLKEVDLKIYEEYKVAYEMFFLAGDTWGTALEQFKVMGFISERGLEVRKNCLVSGLRTLNKADDLYFGRVKKDSGASVLSPDNSKRASDELR